MANIGFIGTGIMGLPMAQNLQKAGHHLFFSELYKKTPKFGHYPNCLALRVLALKHFKVSGGR